jgi:hypothetical protein
MRTYIIERPRKYLGLQRDALRVFARLFREYEVPGRDMGSFNLSDQGIATSGSYYSAVESSIPPLTVRFDDKRPNTLEVVTDLLTEEQVLAVLD